jgi:hypothetical protein
MYRILGTDQKESGSLTTNELRQWIADGRATPQTRVRIEGASEWRMLSEFPEFQADLAGKEPPVMTNSVTGTDSTAGPANGTRRSSGMAITSFVLGLLGLFGCSIFAGIPAIVLGHIALHRSHKAPTRYGGGGFGIAGFVLGYLSLAFVPIVAGLMLPALAKAKAKAQQINCVNNLKQIGLGARVWATDHNGKFPPDFISMSSELGSPKVLVCPADSSITPAAKWSEFTADKVSYEYVEPEYDQNQQDPGTIVFRCPIHGSVGLGDGSVQQRGGRMRRR